MASPGEATRAAHAAANARGDAKPSADAGKQTLSAIANFVKTSAGQLSFAKGDALVVFPESGAVLRFGLVAEDAQGV